MTPPTISMIRNIHNILTRGSPNQTGNALYHIFEVLGRSSQIKNKTVLSTQSFFLEYSTHAVIQLSKYNE